MHYYFLQTSPQPSGLEIFLRWYWLELWPASEQTYIPESNLNLKIPVCSKILGETELVLTNADYALNCLFLKKTNEELTILFRVIQHSLTMKDLWSNLRHSILFLFVWFGLVFKKFPFSLRLKLSVVSFGLSWCCM